MKKLALAAPLAALIAAYATPTLSAPPPDEAPVAPMMAAYETHFVFFSDDTFTVIVGERGYNCYQTFRWGVPTDYILDIGGESCGGTGGNSEPQCFIDGFAATCPATVCHFLGTCEPCGSYYCPPSP